MVFKRHFSYHDQIKVISEFFSIKDLYTYTNCVLSEIHSTENTNIKQIFDICIKYKYQKQLAFEFLRDGKGTTAHEQEP